MRFVKPLIATGLAAAIAATSLVGTADARWRHRDAFFAGAAGFAAGAFLSSLAQPRYYYEEYPGYYYDEPAYYRPAPRVYYEEPAYGYRAPQRYGPCSSGTGTSRPAWAMC